LLKIIVLSLAPGLCACDKQAMTNRNDQIKLALFLISLAVAILMSGCQNAIDKEVRKAGYSAYEMVGVEKRDLLNKRVSSARSEEQDASKDFKDALTRLEDLYGHPGGNLEHQYNRFKSSYDRANDQAQDVHNSIRKVETVASDLFEEWQNEIKEMKDASLREKSRHTLAQTQDRYDQLHESLLSSEKKMDPVLGHLKDQVLFLKHNLDAQAIGSLKGEQTRIQGQVDSLLTDMNKSIADADALIKTME
jgi:hypothetical protein